MDSRCRGTLAGRDIKRGREVSALAFVLLAEAEMVDDITIAENAELFPPWDKSLTGKQGTIVVDDGVIYKAKTDIGKSVTARPGDDPEHWEQVADTRAEWPEWAQPHGIHDAYPAGAKVTHNKKKWVSDEDGNMHEPGIQGWSQAK